MSKRRPPPFHTREEIERYFSSETIECLLCGRRFRRLGQHLAAKHDMSVDDYRHRFGLPWSRGLTSAASRDASGWNSERREKARKVAQQSRFFELAHPTPHREPAPFLKAQSIENLGSHAAGFDETFEERVLALFHEDLSDAAIAHVLNVGRTTIAKRTMRWRLRRPKARR
jgi:ROS/MUCR transcriptional regulator protein